MCKNLKLQNLTFRSYAQVNDTKFLENFLIITEVGL